jgi:hypothetical protein
MTWLGHKGTMPVSQENLIITLTAIQDVLRVQSSLNRIMKRAKVPFTEWTSGRGPKPDMTTLNAIVHLMQCSETVRAYCHGVQDELHALLEKNGVTLTIDEISTLNK